jgi:hypothetical protein
MLCFDRRSFPEPYRLESDITKAIHRVLAYSVGRDPHPREVLSGVHRPTCLQLAIVSNTHRC